MECVRFLVSKKHPVHHRTTAPPHTASKTTTPPPYSPNQPHATPGPAPTQPTNHPQSGPPSPMPATTYPLRSLGASPNAPLWGWFVVLDVHQYLMYLMNIKSHRLNVHQYRRQPFAVHFTPLRSSRRQQPHILKVKAALIT